MRAIIVAAVTTLALGSALAQEQGTEKLALPSLAGDGGIAVEQTRNLTGTCGGATVRIIGVKAVTGHEFEVELDTGKVIVRGRPKQGLPLSGPKELVLDNGYLSDFNGLQCVKSASGQRLLLWSKCGGSGCGNKHSFYVIDPEGAALIAPKSRKSECDARCAAKALGNDLPLAIDRN